MVLLMETAAVLDARAGRASDPTQAAVLRRRAEQRLREAESIRAGLAADGAAIASRGRAADADSTGNVQRRDIRRTASPDMIAFVVLAVLRGLARRLRGHRGGVCRRRPRRRAGGPCPRLT